MLKLTSHKVHQMYKAFVAYSLFFARGMTPLQIIRKTCGLRRNNAQWVWRGEADD